MSPPQLLLVAAMGLLMGHGPLTIVAPSPTHSALGVVAPLPEVAVGVDPRFGVLTSGASLSGPGKVERQDADPSDWDASSLGGIDPEVLTLALHATGCAVRKGVLASAPGTLTVIDYSKSSSTERLWVFDLSSHALLYRELVAHGQGSGDRIATRFSNNPETHQSSLGLFVADQAYIGKNGYSLRLDGLEAGFNDRARERAIVIHGAGYVSAKFAQRQGRVGRSWGCPALRLPVAHALIDRVRGGGMVFAYYPDHEWLRSSSFLGDCSQPLSSD